MSSFVPKITIILHMCTKNHNHMMYGCWDTEWDRQNCLSFCVIFCPFSPLNTWKIKILKLKKTPGDIVILYTYLHHKWQSHDVWFLRYEPWHTEFFVILDCFLPFYHPDNPKNQNFEKLKKTCGDIIVLYMCTINDNQMMYYCMYYTWDIEFNRQIFFVIFFVILDCFLPFYPPNNPKYENFEKI